MKLPDVDRLLAEALIEPIQGSRFQPTGFPSLGSAEFEQMSDDGQTTRHLLVESAQSMANRLEKVCWDSAKSDLVDVLRGLPIVTVENQKGDFITNSLLEAHRLNSSYMLEGKDKTLYDKLDGELRFSDKEGIADISKLARFALKYDPNTILHGVFLSKKEISGGRYKMTRSLSSFIEADGVRPVPSGGVKMDHVDPKGSDGGAKSGFGHVLYPRTEYSAKTITTYFSIDLSLIRSYGLPDPANEFLYVFALWKIRAFLDNGMRLRTACDMKIKKQLTVTQPEGLIIPSTEKLSESLKKLIRKCREANLFASKPLVIKYAKK